MPIKYKVQIEKANTINELDNIKQKIKNNYDLRHSPLRYSKLMISIDDKMYLMISTIKDAKDKAEDEINNAFNNIEKWKKIHEEALKKRNELHKNPIIILSP